MVIFAPQHHNTGNILHFVLKVAQNAPLEVAVSIFHFSKDKHKKS